MKKSLLLMTSMFFSGVLVAAPATTPQTFITDEIGSADEFSTNLNANAAGRSGTQAREQRSARPDKQVPHKVRLSGLLAEGQTVLTGEGRIHTVPSGKRFFIKYVSCFANSYSIGNVAMGVVIFANASGQGETIWAKGPFGDSTFHEVASATEVVDTYVDGGARLTLAAGRSSTPVENTEGFINDFSCTLTGYLQNM